MTVLPTRVVCLTGSTNAPFIFHGNLYFYLPKK
nr:MAG TPA: NifT/FixU protein [Caudoviricetes sp.]DAT07039.1 MAG TPA: NifT/FixU protein [Caudoviricetes sp.]